MLPPQDLGPFSLVDPSHLLELHQDEQVIEPLHIPKHVPTIIERVLSLAQRLFEPAGSQRFMRIIQPELDVGAHSVQPRAEPVDTVVLVCRELAPACVVQSVNLIGEGLEIGPRGEALLREKAFTRARATAMRVPTAP